MIGLVGTTIAPWMQFYIQASTVEKSVKKEELSYARIDVVVGSIMAVVVAAFIIITCGATLFKAGIKVESAAEAAQALAPLAGKHAETLFAFGLLVAGLFSSGHPAPVHVVPRLRGHGLARRRQLPLRRGQAVLRAVRGHHRACGAVPILIPGMPLVKVMYFSQVCNGVLLPFVLLMMLRLVNDKDLMGEHTNGLVLNAVAYLTVVLVILMTLGVVPAPAVHGVVPDHSRERIGASSDQARQRGVSHACHSQDDPCRSRDDWRSSNRAPGSTWSAPRRKSCSGSATSSPSRSTCSRAPLDEEEKSRMDVDDGLDPWSSWTSRSWSRTDDERRATTPSLWGCWCTPTTSSPSA